MRQKLLIPILLSALIIFPQYAFADVSFSDSNSTAVPSSDASPSTLNLISSINTASSSQSNSSSTINSTASQQTIQNTGSAQSSSSSTIKSNSTASQQAVQNTSLAQSNSSSTIKSNSTAVPQATTQSTSSAQSSSSSTVQSTSDISNSTSATSSITVNNSATSSVNSTGVGQQSTQNVSFNTNISVNVQIPVWIRNDAKWWSEGVITDSEFAQGIKYLVQEKIIVVPQSTDNPTGVGEGIPSWIKNNARWWSQGEIPNDDFIKGIQFMVQNGYTFDTASSPTGINTNSQTSVISSSTSSAQASISPGSSSSSASASASSTVSLVSMSSPDTTQTQSSSSNSESSSPTSTISFGSSNGTSVTPGPDSTSTTIVQNQTAVSSGRSVTFTVSVADTSSLPTAPTGTVSWSDGNTGGTFNPSSCTLSSGSCTVTYTPGANPPSSITITASYGGDGTHATSSNTSQLSINSFPISLSLTTDQSYYAYGDVVTLSVNLPGQSLQNIAVGVSDPNGDNIISRTITTDQNGSGTLQFKIPDTYQTGTYQDVATAIVDGKSYTNSTEFNVIKSHGISIDSVQLTNQQGDPVSMLKKGQNGFVKVSLSSGQTIPALVTLNLFDVNQTSLGTASVKTVVNQGQSQMTLSFFIPSSSQAGLANVYTDAYSDWPANGGTPLTPESCLATDLQNPLTLPVSYVPTPSYSCTTSMPGGSGTTGGTTQVAMTNNQAKVTLGVKIQNDSMTFMSPAEAHLLALAYDNGTANTQNGSVDLVSLNLNNASSVNPSGVQTSGNVTTVGPAQFTTIAGPGIQNNPMALKILQEIEASKKQVANILGNETAAKLNAQLVLEQRQAAASQLKQALTALEQANANTTPDVSYANFLNTVGDNRTQAVFQNEYNFMKQRTDAANTAMQAVLNNGGSLDQALLTFNQYATINHVQMVSLNNELNVAYGLADSRIQSCFNSYGQLTVVNGTNPCVANIENNSTGQSGISIISVQPTDQNGNPVSLLKRGQTGYVKVVIDSSASTPSLVTIDMFDSNISSLGTVSAQYTLNPGQSEVVLPYYVPAQSGTGLASIYANAFTDWPSKGGTSQSNELSYFVGLE